MNPTTDTPTTFLAQTVPAAAPLPSKAASIRIATPVDILLSFGTAVSALTAARLLVLAGSAASIKVPEGSTHVALALASPSWPRGDRMVHLTATDGAA